ncbi:acyl-CoA carboxylase subunit epsilon [Amycolatopsis sp. cg5]|uniref:acyl-CoA carboxylase subunit epsilon n=1 Tax=Amycolatopsis sp. cg5 TaxID=3238802 RepID=UPI0035237F3D
MTGPWLRVVRGEPDPAELAALVAVLSTLARGETGEPARVRPVRWTASGTGWRATRRWSRH